jgi:hypothetical protein
VGRMILAGDDDPYAFPDDSVSFKIRMGWRFGFAAGLVDPRPVVQPIPVIDDSLLPEPLRKACRAATDPSRTLDERRAAAEEFLILSREWV